MGAKKPFAKTRIDYIRNLVEPSKSDKILNIGISNIPEVEMSLENDVKECWTLDIDPSKLEGAKKFLGKTKLINADFLKEGQLPADYFDKVIMLEVLEHLDNDEEALRKINFILKKGGSLIVAVPNNSLWHIINPVKYIEHKRHYSNERIRKLLAETGFEVVHFNVVECWTLLANLWVHLFTKFILRRNSRFGFFRNKAGSSYGQYNKTGVDIIIKAVKH